MAIKDYYELLEIPPGTPELEIRQAFRKLAMRYHPDRNVGNPYAAHHFREIMEAYEVLSNPVSRSEYHQKRWSNNFSNHHSFNTRITPALIEKEAHKIARYIKNIDEFRMNADVLYNQLEQLLNPNHLSILLEEKKEYINENIISLVLRACEPLPYPKLGDIPTRLVQLAASNNSRIIAIHNFVRKKRSQFLWEKYKGILMILIALSICIGIYRIA